MLHVDASGTLGVSDTPPFSLVNLKQKSSDISPLEEFKSTSTCTLVTPHKRLDIWCQYGPTHVTLARVGRVSSSASVNVNSYLFTTSDKGKGKEKKKVVMNGKYTNPYRQTNKQTKTN